MSCQLPSKHKTSPLAAPAYSRFAAAYMHDEVESVPCSIWPMEAGTLAHIVLMLCNSPSKGIADTASHTVILGDTCCLSPGCRGPCCAEASLSAQ